MIEQALAKLKQLGAGEFQHLSVDLEALRRYGGANTVLIGTDLGVAAPWPGFGDLRSRSKDSSEAVSALPLKSFNVRNVDLGFLALAESREHQGHETAQSVHDGHVPEESRVAEGGDQQTNDDRSEAKK